MGLYSVYKLTSPNGKCYIGITSRKPEYRWNYGKGYMQNKHLYSAVLRYGWENFNHEIVARGLTKETACELERTLIALYKSNNRAFGYNNSEGGESPNQGHKASAEEIAKRVAANKGKKRTEIAKKHISEAKRGRPNGLLGKTGVDCMKSGVVYQIDRESNDVVCVYYGFPDMNRKTGYAMTPVKEATKGQRKQAYGFLWKYEKRG